MEINIHLQVLIAVFAIAIAMGAVANKTSFCTLGAVSDWLNMGHTGRMRAWVFSMAVVLLGVVVLEALGKLDLGTNTFPPYRTPAFAWLRYIVGGSCSVSALRSRAAAAAKRSCVSAVATSSQRRRC